MREEVLGEKAHLLRVVSVFACRSLPAVSCLIPWCVRPAPATSSTCSRASPQLQQQQQTRLRAESKVIFSLVMLVQLASTLKPVLAYIDKACLDVVCIVLDKSQWGCNMIIWPSFAIWGPDFLAKQSWAPQKSPFLAKPSMLQCLCTVQVFTSAHTY